MGKNYETIRAIKYLGHVLGRECFIGLTLRTFYSSKNINYEVTDEFCETCPCFLNSNCKYDFFGRTAVSGLHICTRASMRISNVSLSLTENKHTPIQPYFHNNFMILSCLVLKKKNS